MRLGESLYGVKHAGGNGTDMDDLRYTGSENYCPPIRVIEEAREIPSEKEFKKSSVSNLCGHSLYVDTDVSAELKHKVV